jgi:hypothetical protein
MGASAAQQATVQAQRTQQGSWGMRKKLFANIVNPRDMAIIN